MCLTSLNEAIIIIIFIIYKLLLSLHIYCCYYYHYYYYYHKLFSYHGYNLLQKGLRHQLIYSAKIVYQTLWNSIAIAHCIQPLKQQI